MLGASLLRRGNGLCRVHARAFSTVTSNVIMLIAGPPGGGKGTISKRLKKDFGFEHLSSGDMLRAQVAKQTKVGKMAETFMKEGQLVPDEVMVSLVINEMQVRSGRILLDGFPRTLPQMLALENKVPISLVMNLDVPAEEIVERISDRWTHVASGRVYSYSFNPPKEEGKDDVTGEALIRRPDDEPESIRKRLEAYEAQTKPLLKHFDDHELLASFDGSNYPELLKEDRRSDAIYKDLKPLVEKKLADVESTLSFNV